MIGTLPLNEILSVLATAKQTVPFFFFKCKVPTGNEWFGNFQIESRHSANESFSKFELHALYDNMYEQKIGKLPKTIPNTPGFHRTNDVISFSIHKRYKTLTLGVWGPNFCGALKLIRFFYYQCPSSTTALVNFKEQHLHQVKCQAPFH